MNNYEEYKLSDIVQYGDSEKIKDALFKIRQALLETTKWIQENKDRNQKNLVLHNFLKAAVPYIDLTITHCDGPIQILAFCARNLYELHLQSRHVQKEDANLNRWVAEAATDSIEIFKGIIGIDPENKVGQHDILKKEIVRKETLLKKHGLEGKKPYQIYKIAAELGRKIEHDSLFKLFSKLLHPTSYLVNSAPKEIQNKQMFNVMITHIQLYSWDIIGNIRTVTDFPSPIPP